MSRGGRLFLQSSVFGNESNSSPTSGPVHTHPYFGWLRKNASASHQIIDILGLGHSESSGPPLELEDFAKSHPNPSGDHGSPSWVARRSNMRLRKLERLAEQEEMKFSHSIQFNAVPDWSSNYISYSNLKKL